MDPLSVRQPTGTGATILTPTQGSSPHLSKGNLMNAQEQADIGDHRRELEESNLLVAWKQAKKELEADLYARLNAAPRSEQNDLRWILSTEWAEWMRANPKPPEPVRTLPYKPLALVGRGDNRSGPLTDG